MSRNQFIESLRVAYGLLPAPRASSGRGAAQDLWIAPQLHSADLWLSRKSVEGFDPADFKDLPEAQQLKLKEEVAAFSIIAEQVPATKPATKAQNTQARKHLENIIQIVGETLRKNWLEAQRAMLGEAKAAAEAQHWHVEELEKELSESLLGQYKAPRLRIKTLDTEVVFDPIAYFGAGHRGIVDLIVLPTYETAYLLTFEGKEWQIESREGASNRKPFSQKTFVNTIVHLKL